MGMEPLNSINSLQVQTMTKPAQPVKTSSESGDGAKVETAVPKMDGNVITVSKSQEGNKQNQGHESQEQQQKTTSENIKKAVENLNKNLYNTEAVFGIHEKTNRVTIKIVDKETKELIKEFPPEKTLDMIAKVWEIAGLLVDERR